MMVLSTQSSAADEAAGFPSRLHYRWPQALKGQKNAVWYGADYNPEQWGPDVWKEDVRLMKKAGVNIVTLAVFSWARLEPHEGQWDFAWLDQVINLLGSNGIAVDLATSTATVPQWLALEHPEILPVDRDGKTFWPGARQHWRPTSPTYRHYEIELVKHLARHYKDNPYIVSWHIGNEYGCHNLYDFSDDANRAFQQWCRARYGTIEAVNRAWGTDFWSQRLTSFDQIMVPRWVNGFQNPGRQLDFCRFSSDAEIACERAEAAVLTQITPDIPFTTNFMVSGGAGTGIDYDKFGTAVNFVSNDHYFTPGVNHFDELAYSAALVDGMARKMPWLLMEHSTSAVNWRGINYRMRPGEMERDSFTHLAFGADGILYFQWRQSQAGAEKYHSAMLPHAGENSQIYRDVCQQGKDLQTVADAGILTSRVKKSDIAIIFDNESAWALHQETSPSRKLAEFTEPMSWFRALADDGVTADVVPLHGPWSEYKAIVIPNMYLMDQEFADRVREFVRAGGTAFVTYMSGIADRTDRIYLGGYPGALRDVTGVRFEEFNPLGPDKGMDDHLTVVPSDSSLPEATAHDFADPISDMADSVTVLARYRASDFSGMNNVPAITSNPYGSGRCIYVGCRLDHSDLAAQILPVLRQQGIDASADRGSIMRVVRVGQKAQYVFLFNRTDHDVNTTVSGTFILGSRCTTDSLEGSGQSTVNLQEAGFAVIRQNLPATGAAE
jgi:beta-galactosidase